jgi:hypothetical protein
MSDAYYTQYTDDYATLDADTTAYNDAVAAEANAEKAYEQQYANLCASYTKGSSDPTVYLMAFMELFLIQGTSWWDNTINKDASIMTLQGDMSACGSDIENMYNDGSDATISQIATAEDQMLDLVNTTGSTSGSTSDEAKSIQTALGSSTSDQLYGYMLNMRKDIYVADPSTEDDNTYNPMWVDAPGTTSGDTRTFHFSTAGDTYDPTTETTTPGDGYIGNIDLLTYSLSQSGDPYQATEAKQIQTDNSNEWNSTLSSASQATQEIMTNDSNQEQTWFTFEEDLGQSLLKVSTASVTDEIPA